LPTTVLLASNATNTGAETRPASRGYVGRLGQGLVRAGTRWTLVAVTALLIGGLVLGYVTYRHQNARITALELSLATSNRAQSSSAQRLDHLDQQLTGQVDGLTALLNQVNARPAAADVAKKAEQSVFTVSTSTALGSAFVVSSPGDHADLLTNYHVVEDDYREGVRSVRVRKGSTTMAGQIIDVAQADDLAVIRVHRNLPALQFATHRAQPGDSVLAMGSPNGLSGTVTSGIVSSYRRLEATDYLQFSAPISPGNSGGPVLDETGQVLGVTVMKDVHDFTEGISYAIPAARVCEALDVC